MAIINCRHRFPMLKITTRFSVILPSYMEKRNQKNDFKYPILWLLGADGWLYSDWIRHTHIEDWAEKLGIAVVMPEGLHSDYTDMAKGLLWYQYISLELPEYLHNIFPVSDKREDTHVFGIGMGGLGAIKLAFRQPERFASSGAASTDAELFVKYAEHNDPEFLYRMETIYGDEPLSPDVLEKNDPFTLAERAEAAKSPKLYLGSSDESRFKEGMQRFGSYVNELNFAQETIRCLEADGWAAWEALLKIYLEKEFSSKL